MWLLWMVLRVWFSLIAIVEHGWSWLSMVWCICIICWFRIRYA